MPKCTQMTKESRRLIVTFVQATVLNALANVLAQLIDQRHSKVRTFYAKSMEISMPMPKCTQMTKESRRLAKLRNRVLRS
jgi:uncharacterized membrane protein